MGLSVEFISVFWVALGLAWPLLVVLVLLISLIGLFVGRVEKLSLVDSLYFAFVTATTVGYGDYTPKYRRTKLAAIVIAFTGILLTGIIVAAGLKAVEHAMREHYSSEQLKPSDATSSLDCSDG